MFFMFGAVAAGAPLRQSRSCSVQQDAKPMKMFLLAAVAACAIAAPASADNYVQTATVTSSAPKVATLNFNQFDASLGTLNSVTLMFSSVLDASGSVTNNSSFLPHTYLLSTGAIAGLTGNGFNFMQ